MAINLAFMGRGRDHDPQDQTRMGEKSAMPSTKGDAREEKGACTSINVNVGIAGIVNTVVQRIKNEDHWNVQIPQADREKSARQTGAARTARGGGEVTLPAAQAVERALRTTEGVGEVTLPAAQAVGCALRENNRQTVHAPGEKCKQVNEDIHCTMSVQTNVIRNRKDNKATKIGIMQIDPYSMAKTPINITKLKMALRGFPSRQCAKEIELGFSEGYKIGYIGPREFRECKNLKSAYENKEGIREKIRKELAAGRKTRGI
jgi:hypothetical protein